MNERRYTPNQVVAFNLARAREERGWTQEETVERLAPFLGTRWTAVALSAAERSVTGRRVREFTASEILAFSRAFDLPIAWFFLPPHEPRESTVGTPDSAEPPLRPLDLLERLFPSQTKELADELNRRIRAAPNEQEFRRAVWRVVGRHVSAVVQILGHEATITGDLRAMAEALQLELDALRAIGKLIGEPMPEVQEEPKPGSFGALLETWRERSEEGESPQHQLEEKEE